MRFFGRSLTGLFLAALTLGLLALAAQVLVSAFLARGEGGAGGMPARERVFTANVMTVSPGRVVPRLEVFGEVRSRRTMELRAPTGGTVLYLDPGFEDGAEVTEGQVILRLDPADAQAARDLAAAARDEAAADLREAEQAVILAEDDLTAARTQADLRAAALKRQQDLETRGVGSAAAVEQAALAAASQDQAVLSRRQALASAEARVDQGRAALSRAGITLDQAERTLADTVLRAGFSGRLNDVSAVEGGIVSPNERLGELIDPDALEVAVRLSTAQFSRLVDDRGELLPAAVEIRLEGSADPVPGRLTRTGAAVGEGQTGRLVYATPDAALGLKPGDFVSVTIDEPALDAVAFLPASAVDGASTVLALAEDDRLEAVPVTVLRRQGDGVIVGAEPLAGREIVSERAPILGAGIRIRPVRPGAAAEAPAPPEMVALSDERRAELVAMVEANSRMPDDAKARVLEQLAQERVPASVIERLERRSGG